MERDLIRIIQKSISKPSRSVLCGIGDDTAVLSWPKSKMLATIDMLVEGVHFSREHFTFEEIGHKALAVNLSDIASMGGTPVCALVSLALPKKVSEKHLKAFYRGMNALARRHATDIVGGNLTRSEKWIIDVAVLGTAEKPIYRRGARVGDSIAVSGSLGNAAAGLEALLRFGNTARKKFPTLCRAQLQPSPRIHEGKVLARTAHSLIDVSDGLASELHHLAEQSRVGIEIEREKIPLSKEIHRAAKMLDENPYRWALNGGEDYELLFTFSPGEKISIPYHVIGKVVNRGKGIRIRAEGKLKRQGWDPFLHS